MNTPEQDALEIAKIAAMVGGQLKQVDSFTSQTVNSSKGPTNQINAEQVYHQQKQRLQQEAGPSRPAAPPPPPPPPPPTATAPLVHPIAPPLPPPPPPVVQIPYNESIDIEPLVKSIDQLSKKLISLTTAVNKLQKSMNEPPNQK